MVKEFVFKKKCNPEALHKKFAKAGFKILGIVFDVEKNQTTVMLDDAEEQDPTQLTEEYVFVEPVVEDYPKEYAETQDAISTSLLNYKTAVEKYTVYQEAWDALGNKTTGSNSSDKLTACAGMVSAMADAMNASNAALSALISAVEVMAKTNNLIQETYE